MFFLGQRFQGIRVSLYIYERTYFTSKKKAILYMFILRLALYDINLMYQWCLSGLITVFTNFGYRCPIIVVSHEVGAVWEL